MSFFGIFESAGGFIFSAFDVFTRRKETRAKRKIKISRKAQRHPERPNNKVGFFSWLFGDIITTLKSQKPASKRRVKKRVMVRRRRPRKVAVNPFAALAAEAEMEAAEQQDAQAEAADVDETAVLAMQEQLAAMQRQIEQMRSAGGDAPAGAAEEAASVVPAPPTPPPRDDRALQRDSPPPPPPPRTPPQSGLQGLASPMLVPRVAIKNATPQPSDESMSVSDMIKQNLKMSLRKTDVQRSPGGTPFRKHDENSPAGGRTLAGALRAKFQQARPPSPSRIVINEFGDDEDDDDWMTPPSTPVRY